MRQISELITAPLDRPDEPQRPTPSLAANRPSMTQSRAALSTTDKAAMMEALRAHSVTAIREREMERAASSTSGKPILPAHTDRIWTRLTEMFGHKLISGYGAGCPATWRDALLSLTVEQVKHGLEECLTWESEWPPTLPQFLKLCKTSSERPEHRVSAPALPTPEGTWDRRAAVATEACDGLREGFRLNDWLRANEKRKQSDFDAMLGAMRGLIAAAKRLKQHRRDA